MWGKKMIIEKKGASHLTYHFLTQNFGNDFLSEHLQIEGIGKVLRTPIDQYYYNGLERPDINNSLFQYTISGAGTIRVGNTFAKVLPGQAFMVSIPGDHEYYLDPLDEKWEFYYIMLHGEIGRSACLSRSPEASASSFPLTETHARFKLWRASLKTSYYGMWRIRLNHPLWRTCF